MNLVGKIFIFLIFIMSLVFMGFAVAVYATHKNWKEVVERPRGQESATAPLGLKFQIEDARERNTKLKVDLDKLREELNAEITAKEQALTKLGEARKAWDQEAADLRTERDKLQEQQKMALATLDTTGQQLETLTKEVGGLRDEIRVAQDERDRHFQNVIRLTDQIQQTQGELKRLEERRVQLVTQVASQKKVLAAYDLNEFTPIDKRPPALRAKVLAVSQNDMVELSVGSDDGIHPSHTLDVFRATNYLGKVEVLSTSTDRAVAKILTTYKKGIIQKGDDAATRFKAN